MATLNFVTLDNLSKFWDGVKKYITTQLGTVKLTSKDKTVSIDDYDLSVNIDGTTIVKNESTGKLSVAPAATSVSGKDAIKVTDNSGKQVELVIAEGNKVLSQSTSGLDATLSLKFVKAADNTTGTNANKAVVQLVGKDNAVISEFDASDLVMDGVLDKVEMSGTTLTFTWNEAAGKSDTSINLQEYLKPYTNGNGLDLNGQAFSVKIKENDTYLTVDENGIASKGITEAINTAKSELMGTADAGTTLGSLKDKIEALEELAGDESVADQIDTAIEKLKLDQVGGTDKLITTVSQTNGKVSATAISVSDLFRACTDEEIDGLFD